MINLSQEFQHRKQQPELLQRGRKLEQTGPIRGENIGQDQFNGLSYQS